MHTTPTLSTFVSAHGNYRPIVLKHLNSPWMDVIHLGSPVTFSHKRILWGKEKRLASGFYLIRQGMVRLSFLSAAGQDKLLFYIGENTLFNDVANITERHTCFFTCLQPVEAIFFSKKDIYTSKFAQENPLIMLNWVESLSLKSSIFYNQLCSVGIHSAFTNVCRTLYSMYLFHQENGRIVPYLTQQDLASLLGIHRGSLHKALSRLKHEGIIRQYSRRELVIDDVTQLHVYAEQ